MITFCDLSSLFVISRSLRVPLDRRQALRLGVLTAAAVGTSTVVSRLADAGATAVDDGTQFDEILAGRRIRGRLERRGARLAPAVYIDGVELHLMRSGPGFTTSVNHYQTYGTAREAAHAAVVSLNGAQLLHH
jgi:Tyrosinase co-factor MelC1